jgi:multicomponent K+:H+ antiporter subunit A/multicomponent Na+:H+ antiporter subunit A
LQPLPRVAVQLSDFFGILPVARYGLARMETVLMWTLAWPMAAALAFVLAGGRLGRAANVLGPLVPVGALAGLGQLAPLLSGGPQVLRLGSWVPELEIHFDFLIDGLSMFYAFVVAGVGVLIFFYASCYFGVKDPQRLARFFACLSLFMGAMLGTVLSNNLLVMFVFWETTGIASFLLIGFDHPKESSRSGARMALLITMATGLCLLAGGVMAGFAFGTFDLRAMALGGPVPGVLPDWWMGAALVLVMLGAFGKSAQFPFHFWLPNAMAAPTPVSAYLHSATMVKLGVFLAARFSPVFSAEALWVPLLAGVSLTTMLLGAWLAFRSTDLKAILAWTTVSALGFFIGFYGLGAANGLRFDYAHIANHVIYKACLFMIVGIVDHSLHIRDIRELGGLRRRLPLLAGAAALACAALAGIPGTFGFISKELILADLLRAWEASGPWGRLPLLMFAASSVLGVAIAARLFFYVFWRPEPEGLGEHFHHPGFWIQLPPLLLAGATLVFGCAPMLLGGPLEALREASLHGAEGGKMSLWHGLTPELGVSAAVLVLGAGLYLWKQQGGWPDSIPAPWRWDAAFERGIYGVPKAAGALGRVLRTQQPLDYLPLLLGFVLASCGAVLFSDAGAPLREAWLSGWQDAEPSRLRVFAAAMIAAGAVLVVAKRGWMAQLISLSMVGLMTTFYYVLYRAPDLALTQILVESATLLGVLLLLSRFPRSAEWGERTRLPGAPRTVLNLAIALGMGGLTASLVVLAMAFRHAEPIGPLFLGATVPLAKGTNAVNTILVDFRGFDTLGEIAVLLIAVLGGTGLLMRRRRTDAEWAAGEKGPAGMGLGRREAEP